MAQNRGLSSPIYLWCFNSHRQLHSWREPLSPVFLPLPLSPLFSLSLSPPSLPLPPALFCTTFSLTHDQWEKRKSLEVDAGASALSLFLSFSQPSSLFLLADLSLPLCSPPSLAHDRAAATPLTKAATDANSYCRHQHLPSPPPSPSLPPFPLPLPSLSQLSGEAGDQSPASHTLSLFLSFSLSGTQSSSHDLHRQGHS